MKRRLIKKNPIASVVKFLRSDNSIIYQHTELEILMRRREDGTLRTNGWPANETRRGELQQTELEILMRRREDGTLRTNRWSANETRRGELQQTEVEILMRRREDGTLRTNGWPANETRRGKLQHTQLEISVSGELQKTELHTRKV